MQPIRTLLVGPLALITLVAVGHAGPAAAQFNPNPFAGFSCNTSECVGAAHYKRSIVFQGAVTCANYEVIPCYPYACHPSGKTCQGSCTTDSHCAAGNRCNTARQQCEPIPQATCRPEPPCRTECHGTMRVVYQREPVSGVCLPASVDQCYPSICDDQSGMCALACASSADCGGGAVCNAITGTCGVVGNRCADLFTLLTADGLHYSCGAYQCHIDECLTACESDGDCAVGHACLGSSCVATETRR